MDDLDDFSTEMLTDFERGWITGWLRSRDIYEPTLEQFSDAMFAMLASQDPMEH